MSDYATLMRPTDYYLPTAYPPPAPAPFVQRFPPAIQPGIDLSGAGFYDAAMHALLAVVVLVIGTSWGSAET